MLPDQTGWGEVEAPVYCTCTWGTILRLNLSMVRLRPPDILYLFLGDYFEARPELGQVEAY